MSALAGHVIAALISLQHHPAFAAPPELVVALHVNNPVLVAASAVPRQQALSAGGAQADRALNLLVCHSEESLAILRRAHLDVLFLR